MRRPFKLINAIVLLVIALLLIVAAVLIFGRMDETLEVFGRVAPSDQETVRAQISGVIEKVHCDEGDYVNKGDTIAVFLADEMVLELDKLQKRHDQALATLAQLEEEYQNLIMSESFETQSAFANLRQAEQRAKIAKSKYERAQSLYEKDLISMEERDDRELEYELAKSYYISLKERSDLLASRLRLQIQSQKKEVAMAAGQLEHAEQMLEKAYIVTPLDGQILNAEIEELEGNMVSAGQAIAEIGDVSDLNLVCIVSEGDIPKIDSGQKARIFINAFPHRDYKIFKGTVEYISPIPEINERGAFFEVEVGIDDPWVEIASDSVILQPGLTGKAEIILRSEVRLIELFLGVQ